MRTRQPFFAIEWMPQPWRVAYWDAYDETSDCAENLAASTSNPLPLALPVIAIRRPIYVFSSS